MDPERDTAGEIELLRGTAAGDRAAFARLYDLYAGVLYSIALRVVNNPEDARDVLQDVFIQIWEKAATFDSARGKPMTWAITMARNKAIDRLRALQRRHRLNDEAEKEAEVHARTPSSDSADKVFANEQNFLVRQALGRLPEDQRAAIELAFFSGLTQNEIAERLALPLGTVKARIRRGMMKLKTLV